MVKGARSFEPGYCPPERTDVDKTLALYEKAIDLQPGAKSNAHLAAIIARFYAHYRDPVARVVPRPAKAIPWWRRCIGETSPKQFLWAEAQANLGSALFLTGEPLAAAEAFHAVLALDPEKMELPDWQVWPAGKNVYEKKRLEKELAVIRDMAKTARLRAVDNVRYVLMRYDGAAALSRLSRMAEHYKGTPLGDHAQKMLRESFASSSVSIYRYDGLWDALGELLPDTKHEQEKQGGMSRHGMPRPLAGSAETESCEHEPVLGSQAPSRPDQPAMPAKGEGHPSAASSGYCWLNGLSRFVSIVAPLLVAGVTVFAVRRAIVARLRSRFRV